MHQCILRKNRLIPVITEVEKLQIRLQVRVSGELNFTFSVSLPTFFFKGKIWYSSKNASAEI